MDNFRRVRAEKPIVFVRTVWYPSGFVVNSFTAPEDREYEFSTGNHYLNPENITITYDIYDCYSDNSAVKVGEDSWTGNVTPTIINRSLYSINTSENMSGANTIPNYSNPQFYVYNGGGCRIGIDDADQTVSTGNVRLRLRTAHKIFWDTTYSKYKWNNSYYVLDSNDFLKLTLTKQGDSGSGNVLAHFESLV